MIHAFSHIGSASTAASDPFVPTPAQHSHSASIQQDRGSRAIDRSIRAEEARHRIARSSRASSIHPNRKQPAAGSPPPWPPSCASSTAAAVTRGRRIRSHSSSQQDTGSSSRGRGREAAAAAAGQPAALGRRPRQEEGGEEGRSSSTTSGATRKGSRVSDSSSRHRPLRPLVVVEEVEVEEGDKPRARRPGRGTGASRR